MIFLAKYLNHTFASIILLCISVLSYLYKTLFGTIFGFFIISLITYNVSPHLFDVEPYGFGEMIIWFYELDSGFKTSITTSLVTITGFLIAFQAAQSSWKKQQMISMRLRAAEEYSNIFEALDECFTNLVSYSYDIKETHSLIESSSDDIEIDLEIENILNTVNIFKKNRDDFIFHSNKLYVLNSKFSAEILSIFKAEAQLEKISALVNSLINYLYPELPIIDHKNPELVANFTKQIKIKQWEEMDDRLNEARILIIISSKVITVSLKSPLFAESFSAIYSLFRHRANLPIIFESIEHKKLDAVIKSNNHKNLPD
jgi:hypothetical protein